MKTPDVRRVVGTCMACHHWQIDVRPGAVSDLGGAKGAFQALALAHVEHLPDCPAGAGRVRVKGLWVEPPKMSDGNPATGTLQLSLVPPWWVTK